MLALDADRAGREAMLRAQRVAVGKRVRLRVAGMTPMPTSGLTITNLMPGTHTFEYSLMTYQGSWRDAGVQTMAHSFAYPPLAFATNAHEGSLGGEAPLATISPGIVPTALARSEEDGAPYARAYNATGHETTAAIDIPAAGEGAGLVDLLERPQSEPERVEGAWRVPLRPWEIATVRFGRR